MESGVDIVLQIFKEIEFLWRSFRSVCRPLEFVDILVPPVCRACHGRTFISISRSREILLIFENIGRRIKRVLDYYKLLHSTLT